MNLRQGKGPKHRVAGVLLTLLVTLTGCSLGTGASPGQTSVSEGPAPAGKAPAGTLATPRAETPADQVQTIGGFGVNANVHSWKGGQLKPAIDQIAALGQLTWRVIIDRADWEPARHGDDPAVYDWTYYAGIYEHGKMADLWNTIAYINSKPGQQVMINVMGGVPDWMGGTRIDPGMEDYWVRMISSMVYYGRTIRKLNFTLLGPMNETDYNGIEGPKVDPEQYVRLLHKLSDRLDTLGLRDIKFVGPDTASQEQAASNYLPALARDPVVMAKMAHFGIHSYDGGTSGTAGKLNDSGYPNLDLWVTEFSGPCPGCDSGAPNPSDWESAAATADDALKLLQEGASGLQFYDAWDGYYEHHGSVGYWGALAYDPGTGSYTPRKSYFILKQLFSFVPRGSVRVAASSTNDTVDVVAFKDPSSGRLTVVGRNTGSAKINIRITIAGIPGETVLQNYRTDADSNMVSDPGTSLKAGIISLQTEPNALFTLTGTPSAS